MLYKSFYRQEELLWESDTYAVAYAILLQSGTVACMLSEDDIHRLKQQS